MNKPNSRWIRAAAFALILLAGSSALSAALLFDKAEFAARRNKLLDKIPDGIAIVFGARPIGSYYPYFQNNDFFYLTGVEVPNAILVLDGGRRTSLLFYTTSEAALRNEGIDVGLVHNPVEVTGVDRVLPYEEFARMLALQGARSKVLYTPFWPEELAREASAEKLRNFQLNQLLNIWDRRPTREQQFVRMLKDTFPEAEVRDCSRLIWELRAIKSPAEIALLRKAGRIGVKAHTEMMRATRPGMYEYELSAVFSYVNEKEGARELAYGVIISSGENHPYVHYYKHDRLLKDGDFLVVDAGPDLDYYDIDITTSFPANGKFTPRQKEVYEASLAVHEANLKVYRPGLTLEQCRTEVDDLLARQGFDLTKDYFKRMRGGFGHFVGMATHDVTGGPQVLKPGMVFANEPMVIYADENLGVRVEDTVLITETGCENLTAGIPRTVREIEALMKTPGIPQVLKKAG
ncbi:MAG: aminopeptidase P N-terminal domain-containing protein, partial [Candidatus Aminicenantes bacterium]|nr:aminopeptidase P N-terminal domain-containing protein [Candidatus Aminicenantes bacterium]